MHRSISIVEYKVQQTAFFLCQIEASGFDMFAAQCNTDAFAASARSVTLAMQAVIGKVTGFENWYGPRQEALKQDRLARFFVEYRNVSSKIGDTVVGGGESRRGPDGALMISHYFSPIPDLSDVPEEDVVTVCRRYFRTLLQLVFDAMTDFKYALDDRWYFTEENFRRMGKSFRDAVMECGFPEQWADAARVLDDREQWRVLRRTQTVGCQINDLFHKHLGKIIVGPDKNEAEQGAPEVQPPAAGGRP